MSATPRGTASRSAMERAPRLAGRTHYPSAMDQRSSASNRICRARTLPEHLVSDTKCSQQRQLSVSRRGTLVSDTRSFRVGLEAVGVDADAGAHRRRDRDLLDVAALGGGRLGALQLVEHGA